MTAIPPYLRPKATKLPAGHDATLDPPEAPTDPEKRSAPPSQWPAVDLSRGSDKPPDPPAAAPFIPPPVRSSAPSARQPAAAAPPGRAVALAIPVPDIDPDIAFWPVVTIQRWPFVGHPADGIWPKGWAGIDNTATLYICTQGGSPGTWAAVAGPSSGTLTAWGLASTAALVGSGSPVGVVTPSAEGDLYIDRTTPGLWQANGATDTSWAPFAGSDTGWLGLSLGTGWSIEGGGYARYRKTNGIVYVELTVAQTSAAFPVATLPAGYRPGGTFGLNFPIAAANSGVYGAGYGFIRPNGQIQVNNNDGSIPNFAAFVLSFPPDQ